MSSSKLATNYAMCKNPIMQGMLREMENFSEIVTKGLGHVFGGFVRDVIFPTILGDEVTVLPNDIDLYFSSDVQETRFKKLCVGENYTLTRKSVISSVCCLDRTVYTVSRNGTTLFDIDVYVCEELPINDFNIHQVVFRRVNTMWVEGLWNGYIPTSYEGMKVIDGYKRKDAVMLPAYGDFVHNDVEKFNRIHQLFLAKGWKVFYFSRLGEMLQLTRAMCYGDFCLSLPVISAGFKDQVNMQPTRVILTAGAPVEIKRLQTENSGLKETNSKLEAHVSRLESKITIINAFVQLHHVTMQQSSAMTDTLNKINALIKDTK